MRAHVSDELSTDGKTLIRVVWERESPEANSPTIEAVFQYNQTGMFFELTNLKPGILILLSVTRTDTRKPIAMLDEEEQEVYQMASDHASGVSE